MKIYYAAGAMNLPDDFVKIGVLISYYGLKKIPAIPYCDSLFLDSGAFSAFTKKENINLSQYVDFLLERKHQIGLYASLDDIGSYKKSIRNYYCMIREGLHPIPAFYIGEPFWVLDEYASLTNYIALGGIAKQNSKTRREWLDIVFSKYADKNKIGFHGFGIQDRIIIQTYPWKSVDASSVAVMARFGGICSPWGDIKINKAVSPNNLLWVSNMNEDMLAEWVSTLSYPVDYKIACQQTSEGTKMRTMIGILYYETLKSNEDSNFIVKKRGFGFLGE